MILECAFVMQFLCYCFLLCFVFHGTPSFITICFWCSWRTFMSLRDMVPDSHFYERSSILSTFLLQQANIYEFLCPLCFELMVYILPFVLPHWLVRYICLCVCLGVSGVGSCQSTFVLSFHIVCGAHVMSQYFSSPFTLVYGCLILRGQSSSIIQFVITSFAVVLIILSSIPPCGMISASVFILCGLFVQFQHFVIRF